MGEEEAVSSLTVLSFTRVLGNVLVKCFFDLFSDLSAFALKVSESVSDTLYRSCGCALFLSPWPGYAILFPSDMPSFAHFGDDVRFIL